MYKVPQKASSKKIIEIGVLVLIVVWGCIFAYDYMRYSHGDKPKFAVCKTIDKYLIADYLSDFSKIIMLVRSISSHKYS